tara:strand:+ start:436 stop:1479 length:1044 start_codon:yes stop_codon:yes gene_type:complete
MPIEKVEFEFPQEEDGENKFEIEVEGVEGRENVLQKDKEVKVETKAAEIEVEVVDDTPEVDRGRKSSLPPEAITDEELEQYSDKVKKRIKHFSKGYHDERRVKEQALREKEEAIEYAKKVTTENRQLQGAANKNRATMVEQAKLTVGNEVEAAKRSYKAAYEAGEADAVLNATEALTAAKIRMEKINSVRLPPLQKEEDGVKVAQESPTAPPAGRVVDPRDKEWATKNPWFGEKEGVGLEMTGFALGMHQRLEREGITAKRNPDEYYNRVDTRMREIFPAQFEDGDTGSVEPAKRKRATNVVAAATRSTAPRKIVLTKTQVALANRLGVPLELYAKKAAEESRKNNG